MSTPLTHRRPGQLPGGRHGLGRDAVRRDQRDRLLRATIDVVGTVGFAAGSVEAVISRAGVSRRTFYEHFVDREAAFLAAWDRGVEELLDVARAAARAAEDDAVGPSGPAAHAAVSGAAIATVFEALADDPPRARVVVVEVLAAGDEALGRRAAALDRLAAAIGGPPRTGVGAAALAGGLLELVHDRVRRGAHDELRALAPAVTALLTA